MSLDRWSIAKDGNKICGSYTILDIGDGVRSYYYIRKDIFPIAIFVESILFDPHSADLSG